MVVLEALIAGVILSMLPFFELRGGIPIALAGGFDPIFVLFIAFLANIIVIYPIWFFLDYIHCHLVKIKIYKRISDKILAKMRHKAQHVKKNMQKYEWLALTLLVAVPLPITGAYTGTLIVWILGLDRKKSFLFISLGVLIAAVIVTLATLGIINMLKF